MKSNEYDSMLKFEYLLEEFQLIKRNCRNRKMVYNFKINLNQNLLSILKQLHTNTFTFSKYRIFIISNPKYRIIMSENMRDKLVNHLVSTHILLPNLEKTLIDTNVATRKGKGTSYGFNKLVEYINALSLNKKEIYVLKIDIKKYFYNINHDILISKLKRYITDQKSLNTVKTIIYSTNEPYLNKEINTIKKREINKVRKLNINNSEKGLKIKQINDLPTYKNKKGLPIGNMTSQILAVFYLSDVDHYIKEVLKCKHYIRYMDDFIILDYDYNKLKRFLKLINKKINALDLEINKKSNIHKLSTGFTFLGYTFKVDNGLFIKCSNQTVYRIKRNLNNLRKHDPDKYQRSFASYQGYFNNSDKKFKFD